MVGRAGRATTVTGLTGIESPDTGAFVVGLEVSFSFAVTIGEGCGGGIVDGGGLLGAGNSAGTIPSSSPQSGALIQENPSLQME